MKSLADITRRAVARAVTHPVSYEGTQYVRFGGDGFTRGDARRRMILLDASRRMEGGCWRTINGVHVHLNEHGKIDKGPAALKGKTHAEGQKHVAEHGHDKNDPHVKAEQAQHDRAAGKKPYEIAVSEHKAKATLGHDHPLVKQVQAKHVQKAQSDAAKLNQAERGAIADYTADQFQGLNEYARSGGQGDKAKDTIIAGLDSALAKLPDHTGAVYRSVHLTPELKQQLDAGSLHDKGFASSTKSPGITHRAPTKDKATFKIVGGGGRDISGHSNNRGEGEVLFPRNSHFKVLDKTAGEYGGTHYTLQVAAADAPSANIDHVALAAHVSKIGHDADMEDWERAGAGTNTRQTVPAHVGKHFQGHGVGTAAGLVELLKNGIDRGRTFHTEQLSGVPTGVAMLRDNQPFMVVGQHGDHGLENGIKTVIVDGHHAAAVPALQKAFPAVKFIAHDQAAGELAGQAKATEADKSYEEAQEGARDADKPQYVAPETREDSLTRYRLARRMGLDVAKPKHGSELGYLDDTDQKAFEHHLDAEFEAKHGVIDENDHHALKAAGHTLDYGHDHNDVIGPLVHHATTEPVDDQHAKTIFRASIERRLMEHHAAHGGESDDQDVHGEHAGEYGSVATDRNRTFHETLPGEVKDFLQGRYHLRKLFKTTSEATAAGGADTLGELGADRYLDAVERMGRGKLGRAVDAAKQADDPEIRFLAHVHAHAAPTPKGETRTPLAHMPTDELQPGHSFTIHGEHFHVDEPEEGQRVLLGPSHYPDLPLDAATHVPIDRGSLRRRREAAAPVAAHADDFAPFSRSDARSRLLALSAAKNRIAGAPDRSASGSSEGTRRRLVALSQAIAHVKQHATTRP